jgi:hypothetical protein
VVISERPSGVKRAAVTAPRWRPDALRTVPLRRSTKRTEPSSLADGDGAVVGAERIAPSAATRTPTSRAGFSVAASRSTSGRPRREHAPAVAGAEERAFCGGPSVTGPRIRRPLPASKRSTSEAHRDSVPTGRLATSSAARLEPQRR